MKANEAPKKIYLLPRQGGDYAPYWKTDSQDKAISYYEKLVEIIKSQDYNVLIGSCKSGL